MYKFEGVTLLGGMSRKAPEERAVCAAVAKGLINMVFGDSKARSIIAFGRLDEWADSIARELARYGVEPGQTVLSELPNSPAFAATLLATWRLGAVFAPVNPRLSERDKQAIAARVQPRVVASTAISPVGTTLLWSNPDAGPDHVRWHHSAPAAGPQLHGPQLNDDDRLILFTSGSTGGPKAVVLTEANVAAGTAAVADTFALTPDDRTVAMLPWSHAHGLFGTLLATRRAGCQVVLPTPEELLQPHAVIETVRPTYLTLVPPMLSVLVAGLAESDWPRTGMRFVRTASAPLPLPLAQRTEELLQCPVAESLGCTECGGQVASNPPTWDRVLGTVGTPSGLEVRLVGEDVVGGRELEVRGPGVFSRYLGDPAATAAAFTADGWFRTQDVAQRDEQGRLRIVARLSEVVNCGGYKVAPAEVEAVLNEHPEVESALATGVPNEFLGSEVVAVVCLRRDAQVTKRDLLAHCRAQLADYKVPGQVRFVDSLPKLPNGKPSRRALAALFS